MSDYQIEIVEVIDGDTVKVDIYLGFNVWLRSEVVRIIGIDSPETRAKNPEMKHHGMLAKNRLAELLLTVSHLSTCGKEGKYGRILGDFILLDGSKVSDILVQELLCVKYAGDDKFKLLEEHSINKSKLKELGKW